MPAWRKVVEQVVRGLADEDMQRRAWFGVGPEVSSPGEEFNAFFDDAAIEAFLARSDNGLSALQLEAGRNLVNQMLVYSERLPECPDASEVFDDPVWSEIRRAAARFSKLLSADVRIGRLDPKRK